MNEYPNHVKDTLTALIGEMAVAPEPFVRKPGKDFSRNRKLPFETVMQILISMGGGSIYKELLESQGFSEQTATSSAFVQQREKLLPHACEFLFHEFTQSASDIKTYRGYRLLADDGSALQIAGNPGDPETFFENVKDAKGYNLLHLNALYDLCSRLYLDALLQPGKLADERKALVDMVDRSPVEGNVILIADRNYESYNDFAHIEQKGWKYLIRVKDINSNGILSGLNLPSGGEFDFHVRRVLTRKQTKEIKAHPDVYRYISNPSFDLWPACGFYPISFRVVRIKITDDLYETFITNLDILDFPRPELKILYKMRWGIETSFRELKYAVGLINFHSKKRELIAQEVFARMIMYNFAEMITSHVVISQPDSALTYQVNFSLAIFLCMAFLRLLRNAPPFDLEALIRKNILPIRPNRSDLRKIRSRSAVSFLYRLA